MITKFDGEALKQFAGLVYLVNCHLSETLSKKATKCISQIAKLLFKTNKILCKYSIKLTWLVNRCSQP